MTDHRVTYRTALEEQAHRLDKVVRHVRDQLHENGQAGRGARPAFLGIGASLAAAALPVHLLRARGIAAHRVEAGSLPAGCPPLGDTTVAISQSGRSKETVADFDTIPVQERLAVVNIADSPLGLREGPMLDLGTQQDSKASTIGFTGTLAALAMLAQTWQTGAEPTIEREWGQLAVRANAVASDSVPLLGRLAELFYRVSSVDVIGEGPSTATAEEGALLLREVCRVAASAHQIRNYLHGPQESAVAGIGPKSTGHLIVGQSRAAVTTAAQLAESGHHVGLLTSSPVADTLSLQATNVVVVPLAEVSESQRPILETIVIQHLSLAVAELAGVDPDDFIHTSSDTKLPAAV